jgi:hypothetical protein
MTQGLFISFVVAVVTVASLEAFAQTRWRVDLPVRLE